jgi:hypothetical protein
MRMILGVLDNNVWMFVSFTVLFMLLVIFLNFGEIHYYRSFLNYMEHCEFVKCEVLMALTMKSTVFWDGMLCSQRVSQLVALLVPIVSLWTPFQAYISIKFSTCGLLCLLPTSYWLLAWLMLFPEDGDSTFFQNITELLLEYMVSHPRRQYSSMQVHSSKTSQNF